VRLKRVEMIGFKSFMDRTVLDFRDGVTAVLGPNGSGKSNVVDAVRWVLGEQSPKQLRGEKMEDVIFKGSARRKPLSTAEVTLTFNNDDGVLDIEYGEVAITRRVSREGGSDYFLNRTPCRLKDLKDLLYDTGAGNNAYSIIEQEMVGQVLDPNENKVRSILEEGSGVVRYKARRKEALRKLDLTERDLLRVEDIIEEISRQVRSLARQVGKARRHQKLFGELRSLEIIKAHFSAASLREELQELQGRIEELRSVDSGESAELARHRARIEEMRPAIDELENRRRDLESEVAGVESRLKTTEGELLVLRERLESGGRRRSEIAGELQRTVEHTERNREDLAAARQEQEELLVRLEEARVKEKDLHQALQEVNQQHARAREALAEAQQLNLGFLEEVAERKKDLATQEAKVQSLQERERQLESALEELDRRRSALREELSEAERKLGAVNAQRESLEAELARHREAEGQMEENLQKALEKRAESADELARAESAHEIAARIAAEYEGYRSGAASLLKDEEARSLLRGALAETLVVEEGYEKAFELLFGEDKDALLVDGLKDAQQLAARLAEGKRGRGSFLVDWGEAVEENEVEASLPGRSALELVTIKGGKGRHLRSWLGRVRVVDTAQEAVDAALALAGRRVSFLAREGLFIRHDGLVRGGGGQEKRELSIFGRQEQVEKLAQKVESKRARLEASAEAVREIEAQRAVVRDAVTETLAHLRSLQDEAKELSAVVASRRSLLEEAEQRYQTNAAEREEVRRRLEEFFTHLENMQRGLGRQGADQEASRRRVGELGEEVRDLEKARDEAQELHASARLDRTEKEGQARELESRIHRLSAVDQDLQQRRERLEMEDAQLAEQIERWGREAAEHEEGLQTLFAQRDSKGEELRVLREEIDVRRAELEEAQSRMQEIAERQKEKAQALGELENQMTRNRLKLENLQERIREKYQVDFEEAFAALKDEDLPRDLVREEGRFSMEQVEEFLELRREKMEKMGPVNFAAVEEYDQKKARLQFLEAQRDDLLQSKEHLLQAIDRINRTARTLFHDTFEKVRSSFQEIFTTLFEGGEADLELVKTDDPLEADVIIHARPKGKKIDAVSLLSGGERALTAIAFLFAVYLIKPSPFCILDEVDAPLDDKNIGRFVRLLERFQQKTQFIVITHNKLTMEAADHLYGVTMEESGVSRLVSVTFAQLDQDDPLKTLEAAAGAPAAVNAAGGNGSGNGGAHASTDDLKRLEGEA